MSRIQPARTTVIAATLASGLMVAGIATALAQGSPAPGASPLAAPASAVPSESAAAGVPIGVTLQEVAVIPETTSLPTGSVTLDVENIGPGLAHELVVVRTDLPADGLPTNEDGSFDEDAEGVEVIGELEGIEPGTSGTLTVDLEPGHYVFLCNVVQEVDGAPFSHYQQGMRVDVEAGETGTVAGSPAPAASLAPAASPAAGASPGPVASVAPAA